MTREEVIDMLYGMKADNLNLDDAYTKDKYEALEMAIKALEQEPVLDKIRAEIEQIYDDIDTVSNNEYENAVEQGKERAYENVLDIIDKYKAETEE